MGNLLIRLLIKNHQNTKDPKVREAYGKVAGAVGITTNVALCAAKIAVGLLFSSIAILADGVNNLADASSSLITLVGFRMASRPSDADHPYGHARIEYITGLIVSIFILFIGFQLLLTSFEKIRFPEPVEFSVAAVFVLLLSIALKVWQALFNLNMGKTIQSSTLKATAADSRNDVIATSAVLASLFIGHYTRLRTDGWMGLAVACFIMYSGVQLIKETSSPLLGQAPDMELVQAIKDQISSFDGVLGIHDLVVHDYGPGRIFASVHVEVDSNGDMQESHDLIDNIERAVKEDLHISIVIHMDPLNKKDPLTVKLQGELEEILSQIDFIQSFHDLRVVAGKTHHNVIFDVVASADCTTSDEEIKSSLTKELQQANPMYRTVITVDRNYTRL